MADRAEYLIRFLSVPVNGHVGKADVAVLDRATQAIQTTARINPQDLEERLRLGRRWAKKLGRTPEQIEQAIDRQWCEELKKLKESQEPEPADRLNQAQELLKLAADQDLFHSPDGTAYAAVRVGEGDDRRETLMVRGQGFRSWLAHRYYAATRKPAGTKAVQDALAVLEARARYDGPTVTVHVRVAEHEGRYYLDLGDDRWRVVQIDAAGWRIIEQSPVRFRRPKGMLPLPGPVRGGAIGMLYPFLNVSMPDWPLVVAWLLAALRPTGPYPVLQLHGEQGSAKSTTARVLRSQVDPCVAALRAAPRDEHDLVIAASNSWVVALDNLSSVPPWLSDALCRLATGGGFATRQLFTDDEEAIFDVQRPVILTGIEELASRADLLDRALVVNTPVIYGDRRKPEAEFYREFHAISGQILGALLDLVAGAMRELPGVQLDWLPRMADFVVWSVAGVRSLGWTDAEFLDAYEDNQARAVGLTLENAPIVAPLRDLAAQYPDGWEGSHQKLLEALAGLADEKARKDKGWPRTPRALSGMLRRLAPALRKTGLNISFPPRTSTERTVRVEPSEGKTSATDRHDRHQPSWDEDAEVFDAEDSGGSAPPMTVMTVMTVSPATFPRHRRLWLAGGARIERQSRAARWRACPSESERQDGHGTHLGGFEQPAGLPPGGRLSRLRPSPQDVACGGDLPLARRPGLGGGRTARLATVLRRGEFLPERHHRNALGGPSGGREAKGPDRSPGVRRALPWPAGAPPVRDGGPGRVRGQVTGGASHRGEPAEREPAGAVFPDRRWRAPRPVCRR
jgi:hypothetical protein